MATTRGSNFDPVLVSDLITKVKGKSSLAALSAQTPIPFNGIKEFTFSMDREIDIVAEGGAKSEGGISVSPITIVPLSSSMVHAYLTSSCMQQKKRSLISWKHLTMVSPRRLRKGWIWLQFMELTRERQKRHQL